MRSIAIIGAGITGLTAAFYLRRSGVPVTVYEASDRAGGAIQSIRTEGYLAEFGPNTILETSPKVTQLVIDAGLASRRLDPDPKASARYVVRYQQPIEMPGSPLGFFTTKLFTARAKLAVLREPFVAPRRDGKEESVAEFVVRRLGQEFLGRTVRSVRQRGGRQRQRAGKRQHDVPFHGSSFFMGPWLNLQQGKGEGIKEQTLKA